MAFLSYFDSQKKETIHASKQDTAETCVCHRLVILISYDVLDDLFISTHAHLFAQNATSIKRRHLTRH